MSSYAHMLLPSRLVPSASLVQARNVKSSRQWKVSNRRLSGSISVLVSARSLRHLRRQRSCVYLHRGSIGVASGNWQAGGQRERQLSVLQLIEYHVQLNGISLFA